jgi:hypothetical protein
MDLKGPAPNKAHGGVFGRREKLMTILLMVLGAYVAIRPASLPSSVDLFVLPTVWIMIAVVVSVYLRRWWECRLGLFFAALALLVLGALSLSRRVFSAHEIRTLTGQPATRPSLSNFTKQWLSSRLTVSHTKAAPYTVVLVAAAGGGIRAADWTATQLGWLQDQNPSFSRHLFAISSVSGGSVGAGVFAALLKANCGGRCEGLARAILRDDFLAPAFASHSHEIF